MVAYMPCLSGVGAWSAHAQSLRTEHEVQVRIVRWERRNRLRHLPATAAATSTTTAAAVPAVPAVPAAPLLGAGLLLDPLLPLSLGGPPALPLDAQRGSRKVLLHGVRDGAQDLTAQRHIAHGDPR